MIRKHYPVLLVCVAGVILAGCTESPESSLVEWMAEQRSSLKPRTEVVVPPKQFLPQEYKQEGLVDPFATQKLIIGLKSEATASNADLSLITPELNRRKQPLEAYPLDLMSYVGSLQKGAKKVALLRVDKLLYQVEPGAYLGPNYGKIVLINEAEIKLREIVQDAAGEWVERMATLKLQETQ
ncbi:MAG: pilus assembly protein PilP [Burkholderiaceae bacterium]